MRGQEEFFMKKIIIGMTMALGLVACGNGDDGAAPSGADPDVGAPQSKPADGYTRYEPPSVEVEVGEDKTVCQWVAGPFEEDTDIADITGNQPFPGHHAILFTTSVSEAAGTTRPCTEEDNADAKLLGGVGGEGSASGFPTGAVVRIRKGQSLMMNSHYINTTTARTTGRAFLDVKYTKPSPDSIVASFFVNGSVQFALSPHSEGASEGKCVLEHDIKLIDFTNHMHERGAKVSTTITHAADGKTEDLQRDDAWQYEWQFNPPRRLFSVKEPHVLKAGDTLTTSCAWNNTSAEMITFPREMCFGVGFMVADKDVSCIDGKWIE
jgi:hypothetical protein